LHHIQHAFNFPAILTSGVFLWLLGAAWYSPALFAKPWMTMLGIRKEEGKKSALYVGMIASLVCDLLLAFILAHFVIWSGTHSFGRGVMVGGLVWIGFFAAPNLPQGIYEGRPFKLFAINNGYWLVGLLVVGGLLGAWR
jgi:hypothetical protein